MDLSTWMKWVCVWRSAGDRSVVRARRQPICLGEGSRADPGFSPLCFTRDSWLAQHPWRIVKKGQRHAGLTSKEPVIRSPRVSVEPCPLPGCTTINP